MLDCGLAVCFGYLARMAGGKRGVHGVRERMEMRIMVMAGKGLDGELGIEGW